MTEKRVETFLGLRDGTPPTGTGIDFQKIVSAARKAGNPRKSGGLPKWQAIWEQLLGASQLDIVTYATDGVVEAESDDAGNPMITTENLQRVLRWPPHC